MAAVEQPGRPFSVEANLGLVRQIARRFRWATDTVLDEADLIQAGALGLMRALETYDPELGALSTYAKPWIRVAIQDAISHGRRTVRVHPKAEKKAWLKGESYPLDCLPLDAPAGDGRTWLDLLRSDDDPSAPLDARELADAVCTAFELLQPRQQGMLRARYVDGLSFREIGEQHGFSREYARQLLERALDRLASLLGE